MEKEASIVANGLQIGYKTSRRKTNVVNASLDFELLSGEVTCLLGRNGAGKSTLIKTLCGIISPLGGELRIKGGIGMVLTEKTNAGGLTVYDLVSLGRYRQTGFFGALKEDDHLAIRESLEAVGIADKSGSYMSELSDGERQKAMVAKALAQETPIIILDEPTAFLDVTSRVEIMLLLRALSHEKGKAVLISTHDLDNAVKWGDKLWLMDKKTALRSGTPEELDKSGVLEEFFYLPIRGRMKSGSTPFASPITT